MSMCFTKKFNYQYAKEAWRLKDSICDLTSSGSVEYIQDARLRLLRPVEVGSTWISGPSGIGKTTWAKAYCQLPALWVTHMDDLRLFRAGFHKSIIFDDMSFCHMPRESQIAIADTQQSRSIHIRYGVARIPAGIQKIFTSNVEIFQEDEAIKRRINKILL